MNKIVLTVVALVAAAPAAAQDVPAATVRTGVRVEGRVGWDRPVFDVKASDGTESLEGSAGKSGVVYAGEIGYDALLGGTTVIGAYAGIEGSSVEECAEVYGDDEACIGAGRNITVGVRAGALFGSSGLAYLKGGYSNGALTAEYRDPAAPGDNFDEQGELDGFHLGAGAELGFGRNVYGKLEYVYSNYGDYEYDDGTAAASLGIDRHQVVAGVGFRF